MFSVANGVYQNSVYGTAACLPMKYTNAVVLGSVSVCNNTNEKLINLKNSIIMLIVLGEVPPETLLSFMRKSFFLRLCVIRQGRFSLW